MWHSCITHPGLARWYDRSKYWWNYQIMAMCWYFLNHTQWKMIFLLSCIYSDHIMDEYGKSLTFTACAVFKNMWGGKMIHVLINNCKKTTCKGVFQENGSQFCNTDKINLHRRNPFLYQLVNNHMTNSTRTTWKVVHPSRAGSTNNASWDSNNNVQTHFRRGIFKKIQIHD